MVLLYHYSGVIAVTELCFMKIYVFWARIFIEYEANDETNRPLDAMIIEDLSVRALPALLDCPCTRQEK